MSINIEKLIKSSPNFANLLKFLYEEKKKLNPRFSVRALANQLEISHAYVQKILNGDKKPSDKIIDITFEKFNIDKSYINTFKSLKDFKTDKNSELIELDSNEICSVVELKLLSLIDLSNKKDNLDYYKEILNITEEQLLNILNKFSNLGFIEIKDQTIDVLKKSIRLPHSINSEISNLDNSLIDDVSCYESGDMIEYQYFPSTKENRDIIRRSIGSALAEIAQKSSQLDAPNNEIYQIACFIKPVLKA